MSKVAKVAFVAIGDEIVDGRIQEVNSVRLNELFSGRSIERVINIQVPDDVLAIKKAFDSVFDAGCNLVLASGGLGPTEDDRTREALADFANVPLVWSDQAWSAVENVFRHLEVPEIPISNRRQGWIPKDSFILVNRLGTACGILMELKERTIVALPGVPIEFDSLVTDGLQSGQWADRILPFGAHGSQISEYLIGGIGESNFEDEFTKLFSKVDVNYYAICARRGLLELRIEWSHLRKEELSRLFREKFETLIVSHSVAPLEFQISESRWPSGLEIATMEIGTQGLLCSTLSGLSQFRDGRVFPSMERDLNKPFCDENLFHEHRKQLMHHPDLLWIDLVLEPSLEPEGVRNLIVSVLFPKSALVTKSQIESFIVLGRTPKVMDVLDWSECCVYASWRFNLRLRNSSKNPRVLGREDREKILGYSLAVWLKVIRSLSSLKMPEV